MSNKIIRVENIKVKEETYELLQKLKAETGIPMKALLGLLLNITIKDIKIEHIKEA